MIMSPRVPLSFGIQSPQSRNDSPHPDREIVSGPSVRYPEPPLAGAPCWILVCTWTNTEGKIARWTQRVAPDTAIVDQTVQALAAMWPGGSFVLGVAQG